MLVGKNPSANAGEVRDAGSFPGWGRWLNGYEFEQALGVDDGQGSLMCCSSWGRKELDMIEQLKWTDTNTPKILFHGQQQVPPRTKNLCSLIGLLGFPGGWVVKNPPMNSGGTGLILGFGRSLGEGNSNPLQHCCLGNPVDRGARWATVHGVAK